MALYFFPTDIAYVEVYLEPQCLTIELVDIIHVIILKLFTQYIIISHTIAKESLIWSKVTKRYLPSHVYAHIEQ